MSDPTPIPDAELAELERLHEAATPGRWHFCAGHFAVEQVDRGVIAAELGGNEDNGRLIVAAVNALPALIRTVREQRAEMSGMAGENDTLALENDRLKNEIARLRAQVETAQEDVYWIAGLAVAWPPETVLGQVAIRAEHALAALDGKERS